MTRPTGTLISTVAGGESVHAFVPALLPVSDPPIVIEGALAKRLAAAEAALRHLEIAAQMVPSLDWFLYGFVRKEAVLTSQIEGTQATLTDLLQFEAREDETPTPAVQEVCNYVDALTFARAQLASAKGLPLSMRLLNEAHKRLMRGVRGASKAPGEIRKTQNWIGGSRPGNAAFVPPPPGQLPKLLGNFEQYLHASSEHASLVRAGIAHVQFETLHPYLDGNGRIGRLLIALLLEHWKVLPHPLLYLSLFFRRHQAEYYRRLSRVRSDGDWEGWLDFFLDGVATIGEESVRLARELFALVTADRSRVLEQSTASLAALRLFEALPAHPIVTANSVIKILETTKPTAAKALDTLVSCGVLRETTGKQRGREYAYQAYLAKLSVE
ncbi:MAG TPA: Fic family protein [Steroidobacteraceae bacterium]|nr:Fic family protein [Steroidobacteraceae bacterium]